MKEIIFAQRLADCEKRVRDRALKKLRKYLSIKTSARAAISEDDAIKLWKGLFYCMYMADKPLVQECVAEDISGLVHHINNEDDCRTFVRAGFLTFAREWNGIDVFRIDKYMMFVRRFLRHIFTHLQASNWTLKGVMAYISILEATVICPDDNVNNTPLGLKTHICEVILEELAKVGGDSLHHSVIMAVIQPYFKVLALTKINSYVKFVREGIIHHLIRQSLCTEEEEERQEEGDTLSNGTSKEEDGSEEQMNEEETEVELDPRAGRVDAYIPQLKVDLNLLADSLQKVGAVSRVQTRNREVIYRLVCELRDAAQGHNPLALPNDHLDDVEVPETEIEKAVERLEKFDTDLKSGIKPENNDSDDSVTVKKNQMKSKRLKKKFRLKKNKKLKVRGLPKTKRRKLDRQQRELSRKRSVAVEHMVRRVTTAAAAAAGEGVTKSSIMKSLSKKAVNGNNGFQVSPVTQRKLSNTSPKTLESNFTVELTSTHKKKRKNVENTRKTRKKMCFDVSVLDSKVNDCTETVSVKKNVNVDPIIQSEGQKTENNRTLTETVNRPFCVSSSKEVKKSNVKESNALASVHEQDKTQKSKTKKSTKRVTSVKENENILNSVMINTKTKKKPDNAKESVIEAKATISNGEIPSVTAQESIRGKTVTDSATHSDKLVQPKKQRTHQENVNLVLNISGSKKRKGQDHATQQKKSPWDLPLKEGEHEFYVNYKKQEKANKKGQKSPMKKTLTSSMPRRRTISINLKKNKEHDFNDYVRTLRTSPCIPFKADRTPKAPVLKPSPSPILIKKPMLQKILKKKAAGLSTQLSFKEKRPSAADFF